MTSVDPITRAERINSLDTLRGFALLGILPANVLVFGMYLAAGNDPTVAGGATGVNLASWALFRIWSWASCGPSSQWSSGLV